MSQYNRGITMIEVIIVLSLIIYVSYLTLGTNTSDYQSYSFRNERAAIISSLQKARGQAQNAVCEGTSCSQATAHGVHFENDRHIIFQGAMYDPADPWNEVVEENSMIQTSGLQNVIFGANTATTTTSPASTTELLIEDTSGHTSIVTLNSEGQITWTK